MRLAAFRAWFRWLTGSSAGLAEVAVSILRVSITVSVHARWLGLRGQWARPAGQLDLGVLRVGVVIMF